MEDWRRIDIDALDPENTMTLEELTPEVPPVSSQEVSSKINNIRTLISKGSHGDAILLAVDEPPYGADEQSKELYLNTVIDIFSATKQTDIASIVKSLSLEQQNALLKYLYKGMASKKGQQQGGILLAWYEKTVEVTGLGPVVRYLTDRRTV
ncbi:unnamed protein product [Cyberlindnera jadinii]|uniref:Actin-related protein 2/3 complex subunit 5 n=1 Tax=Cyberlindnera jadinii (strain ATCC 18201 / CBS 1600 / BCRC 20928 / JCM 3617 / NBRC 0987 / NRRL Y-1542) TaxID=983966 RepID=A0A0H5C648_CYBJN|nr:actin-related protein 2/3 complex subunit 5-like protein [Cyberlindnera jadinii NRRL Y-1542]ODV73678.1 actin-related protein 2/3 complex subunit 5-like protein [Cyberlindnera jadinii NRRL Y-1542]CEP23463.1 unnamed protein product [Cyberlindnera jadinii]